MEYIPIFETWNIRTLIDRSAAARSERETTLIACELFRNSIDTAALSETKLTEEGSISEPDGDVSFFWKGKVETEDSAWGWLGSENFNPLSTS